MLSLADVQAAARRLEGVATRTPVLTSRTLDELVGASVFLKAEPFQRSGAFKFRGAYNRLAQLSEDERRAGVVAFSSGNHAQAVALAARLLDVPATILMPSDAPAAKLAATRGYGAEVVLFDRYTEDREALGRAMESERGLTLVPPFDDERIMAGQGTAALELLTDVPDLDVLVAPVGGGGLLSGCAVVAKAQAPPLRVVGVEPAAGDDVKRSLESGARVTIPVPQTIADGQQTTAPGVLTFEVLRANVDEIVLVDDDELVDAMAFCFDRMKLVTEPSGACGVAALLADGRLADVAGRRIGVIVSGGNVGSARFAELLLSRSPDRGRSRAS